MWEHDRFYLGDFPGSLALESSREIDWWYELRGSWLYGYTWIISLPAPKNVQLIAYPIQKRVIKTRLADMVPPFGSSGFAGPLDVLRLEMVIFHESWVQFDELNPDVLKIIESAVFGGISQDHLVGGDWLPWILFSH